MQRESKLLNLVQELNRADSVLKNRRVSNLFRNGSDSENEEYGEEQEGFDVEGILGDEEENELFRREDGEAEFERKVAASLFDMEEEEEGDAEESDGESIERSAELDKNKVVLNEKITRVSLIGDLFVEVCAEIVGIMKKLRKLSVRSETLIRSLSNKDVYLCYVDLLNTILKLRDVEIPSTRRRDKRSKNTNKPVKTKSGKRVRVTEDFKADLYITARFRTTYEEQFHNIYDNTGYGADMRARQTRSASNFIPAEDKFTDFVVLSVATCFKLHAKVGAVESLPDEHLLPGAQDRAEVTRVAKTLLHARADIDLVFDYANNAKKFFRDPDIASRSVKDTANESSMERLIRLQNDADSSDEDDYYNSDGEDSVGSDEDAEYTRAREQLSEERFSYKIFELRRKAIRSGYVFYEGTQGDIVFRNAYRRLPGRVIEGGYSIEEFLSSSEDESRERGSSNSAPRLDNLDISDDSDDDDSAILVVDPETQAVYDLDRYVEDTVEAIEAADLEFTQAQNKLLAPRRAAIRQSNANNQAADNEFATLPLAYFRQAFSKPIANNNQGNKQTESLTDAEEAVKLKNIALPEKMDPKTGILRGLAALQALPVNKSPLLLKPWQRDAVVVAKQKHGVLIFHPTGSGKTFTCLNIVSRLASDHFVLESNADVRCKFIFSVPNALRAQWVAGMKTYLPHMLPVTKNMRKIDFAVISHNKLAALTDKDVDQNTYIFIDEPHTTFLDSGRDKVILGNFIKNANKRANRTYLMTATPLRNSVQELMSYLQILQKKPLVAKQRTTFEALGEALSMGNVQNSEIAKDITSLREMFMCYVSFPLEPKNIELNYPRLVEHPPLLCPMTNKDYDNYLRAVSIDVLKLKKLAEASNKKGAGKGKGKAAVVFGGDDEYVTNDSGVVTDLKTESMAVTDQRIKDTFYHQNRKYSIEGTKVSAVMATLLAHKKFVIERGRRIGFNQPMKVIIYSQFHANGAEHVYDAIKDFNAGIASKLTTAQGKGPKTATPAPKKTPKKKSKAERDREPVPDGGLNVEYSDYNDTDVADKVERFNQLNSNVEVAILTEKTAAGIDFKHVTAVFILEQDFNRATIKQAIGRARRLGSHSDLPRELQEVHIVQFLTTVPEDLLRYSVVPRSDEFALREYMADEELYFLSQQKDAVIKTIRSVLSDCSVELPANKCIK